MLRSERTDHLPPRLNRGTFSNVWGNVEDGKKIEVAQAWAGARPQGLCAGLKVGVGAN